MRGKKIGVVCVCMYDVSNIFLVFVLQVLVEIHGYKESHRLMDGRLFICTIAIGFALFALVWDYLYPFPLSRNVLMTCAISYP